MADVPFHPFRFSTPIGQPTTAAELRDGARRIEDLGYSTVTIADHFDDQLGPIATLMAIADATTTLKIAPLVFCNDYRHPVMLAKEAATLDLLSDGRLELGIGAGWLPGDYAAADIAFDSPGMRISRLGEAIDVITALWTDGPVDYEGAHFNISGLEGMPKPVQHPRPPIIVGGGGQRIVELAARKADIIGFNPNMASGAIDAATGATAAPDITDERIEWIRNAAGDRFSALEFHVRLQMAIVSDRADDLFETLSGGFGLTPAQARATPYALAGTAATMTESLIERRERWGMNYIGVPADAAKALAPVVAKIAGS